MGDDLTLECFLSLLDRAEAVIDKDYLFEERDGFEYSVKEIEREMETVDEFEEISSCHKCNACLERSIFAEPILNPNPKILFVSPMPEGTGIFSSSSYDYFMKWVNAIKLTRREIALTTLIKCPVKEFTKEYADICKEHLRDEMNMLKPKTMVLLGQSVSSYMLRRSGDMDSVFRKRKFSVNSIPVFCTYSPLDLVRNRALRVPIWEDLKFISSFLGEGDDK